MEEEVEDIVGDVNYTDSQKSITASNVYSLDFTDSSSDKNHSSSKETYVIDCDDSDTSDKTYQSNRFPATVQLKEYAQNKMTAKNNRCMEITKKTNRFDRDDLQQYSLHSEEIFTQTSKTIFELAQNEKRLASTADGVNSLETQTSFISITENKTVEYHIQLISDKTLFNPTQQLTNSIVYNTNFVSQALADSLEDKSSIYQESENEIEISKRNLTGETDDKIIKFVDDGSREDIAQDENANEYENSPCDSDIEEDSLDNLYQETDQDISESSVIPKSVDNDIDDLYRKLSRCGEVAFYQDEKTEIPVVGILTPLTEETNVRKTSVTDISPSEETLTKNEDTKNISQITKSKSTVNPIFHCNENQSHFRLPPINNFSCPNSPLNFLFSNACSKLIKTNTLPLVSDNRKERSRWKIDTNASGENPLININKDAGRYHSDTIQLPPINHGEGFIKKERQLGKTQTSDEANQDAISIKEKIRELKMTQRRPRMVSRSPSPTSTTCSPTETKLSDAAERGCEALCGELLRRLRLSSWVQALETLDELPKVLENFWPVISEHRIAELIRQDFFEAIATLLVKTGSFCRPVRKAANVALDLVVCSVDVTHSVTAICVYGTGHKSALVRCASARLLVVCAAFAEGGRLLLRGRPPSAATARAHVLRALSHLLYDKNADTRKYAERLYAMLRPLNNFEAYFLTDVDIETASRQMKKYDQTISTSKLT
ncbi:unnamed protein product [Pieris brassicae]|uniref:TOG domain-containing protein n=1 Tax=Pieris brassicae TaxID=7116 RepID=A0A9P0SWP5_PIEBR|nr:unnamed protein product [Pieris brassicae]